MKLLQRNTSIHPSATIRLKNHILEQLVTKVILFQLARNAPQMSQRDRPIFSSREELKRRIHLGRHRLIRPRPQFRRRDGHKRRIRDEAGIRWIDGGEDRVELARVGGRET